jgi:hypothetical protein
MQSQAHVNAAKAAISVRSPQAPVLDREARFAAGEGATTLGDHPFSLIACIRARVSGASGQCREARGGIPLVAIAVRACMGEIACWA